MGFPSLADFGWEAEDEDDPFFRLAFAEWLKSFVDSLLLSFGTSRHVSKGLSTKVISPARLDIPTQPFFPSPAR
jgi:hypothetical protein